MQATAALAAFNLVCQIHGPGRDLIFSDRPNEGVTTIVFRIDPLLGRWCSGACPAALPIAAISDLEIVLSHRRWNAHGEGQAIRVTRLTGLYRETSFGADESAARPTKLGRCERAPFSAFPADSLRFAIPLRVEVPASID